jgi:hypothetical protein
MAWGPRGEPGQVTITLYPTRNLCMPRRSVREGGGWRRTIPCSMSGAGVAGRAADRAGSQRWHIGLITKPARWSSIGSLVSPRPSSNAASSSTRLPPGDCLDYTVRLAPVVVVPVMVPTAAADRHRHKDAGLRSEGNCQEQQRDPQIAHGAPPTTWDGQKGSSIPARR